MILYIENPKHIKIIRTNKFNKVAGYKINIQESVAFLYTNNEISQRKKQSPLKLLQGQDVRVEEA